MHNIFKYSNDFIIIWWPLFSNSDIHWVDKEIFSFQLVACLCFYIGQTIDGPILRYYIIITLLQEKESTYLSKPATKPKNFRWSSPAAANLAFKSITRSEVAPPPPKEGPCLIRASTTLQTLVCILPKEVMTSGLSPSFMMEIKAGHSSWKRIYRTDVGLSSWYISNRSTAEYKLTKSPGKRRFTLGTF